MCFEIESGWLYVKDEGYSGGSSSTRHKTKLVKRFHILYLSRYRSSSLAEEFVLSHLFIYPFISTFLSFLFIHEAPFLSGLALYISHTHPYNINHPESRGACVFLGWKADVVKLRITNICVYLFEMDKRSHFKY